MQKSEVLPSVSWSAYCKPTLWQSGASDCIETSTLGYVSPNWSGKVLSFHWVQWVGVSFFSAQFHELEFGRESYWNWVSGLHSQQSSVLSPVASLPMSQELGSNFLLQYRMPVLCLHRQHETSMLREFPSRFQTHGLLEENLGNPHPMKAFLAFCANSDNTVCIIFHITH